MATLTARRIYRDDERSIIVVESADIRLDKYGSGFALLASLAPIATVVVVAGRARAMNLEADRMDLDRLIDDVPELSVLIDLSAA